MIGMNENVNDLVKMSEEKMNEMSERQRLVARLRFLESYPRMRKPTLWMLSCRYGLNGRCMNVETDLHETTEYRVRGTECVSEAFIPETGMRKGCSSLLNLPRIFRQKLMRKSEEPRVPRTDEVGVV